jgi:hypothetical protein
LPEQPQISENHLLESEASRIMYRNDFPCHPSTPDFRDSPKFHHD